MFNRLLITGGTGFVGKALLHRLINTPASQRGFHEVAVLSRNPDLFLKQNKHLLEFNWLKFIAGDVLQPNTLRDLYADFVIHAAADSTLGPTLSSSARFEQIVSGTNNVLQMISESNVSRVLYLSSGAVYGESSVNNKVHHENDSCLMDPGSYNSTYGLAKAVSEHLHTLFSYENDIDFVIARCFSFVGPDLPLDVHFAIGNFIRDALWAEEIVVKGDGSPMRTYLDQDDLANWLLRLLVKGRSGETYNVGSDEVISMVDLAHLVGDLIAPDKSVRILGKADPSHARNRYVPDISKARSELGLDVTIPLAESIRRSADAHRKSGSR